jgi:pimeloyl-ACP methyl ester carboxylesterase
MTKINQSIVLPDHRHLGFDEYVPTDGRPLFYFHGTPSSRKDWLALGNAGLPEKLGVRVIVADRPGIGLSDFLPGRRIGDWPADVAALADALEIERFSVFGYSGGGPYVLVCAQKIPQRLVSVEIAAGEGPADQPGIYEGINPQALQFMTLAREKPWQSRMMWGMICTLTRYTPRLLASKGGFFTGLPEADKAVALKQPELGQVLYAAMLESVRHGARGPQWDAALAVSSWDFPIDAISIPVHIWQGECDRNVSPAASRYLARTIPGCQATFFPGEGHISLVVNYLEQILRVLSAQSEVV